MSKRLRGEPPASIVEGPEEMPPKLGGVELGSGQNDPSCGAAPGLGVVKRQSEKRQQKPLSFTLHGTQLEGTKAGSSREYFPGCGHNDDTSVFAKDFGFLEGEKIVAMAMGNLLNKILDGSFISKSLHGKPQPTGTECDLIFPLPLSSEIVEGSKYPLMAKATCRALNLLYGATVEQKKRRVRVLLVLGPSDLFVNVLMIWETGRKSFRLSTLTFSLGLRVSTIVERKSKWHRNFLGNVFPLLCLLRREEFHYLNSLLWELVITLKTFLSFWFRPKNAFWGGHLRLWLTIKIGLKSAEG